MAKASMLVFLMVAVAVVRLSLAHLSKPTLTDVTDMEHSTDMQVGG